MKFLELLVMTDLELLIKICYLTLNLLDLQILAKKLLPFANKVRLGIFFLIEIHKTFYFIYKNITHTAFMNFQKSGEKQNNSLHY